MEITFWNIPDVLMASFPELRPEIEAHLGEAWAPGGRPYPHVFLESYLLHHLVTPDGSGAPRAGVRGYALLERLLGHDDEDLVSATLLNVLEPIASNPAWLRIAEPWFGARAGAWMAVILGRGGA